METPDVHHENISSNLNIANAEEVFGWDNLTFDNHRGLGATGSNSNVLYRGFVGVVRIDDFIALALKADRSEAARRIAGMIKNGQSIACPLLLFHPVTNREGDIVDVVICGHEGRARSTAIAYLSEEGYLDNVTHIPVHFVGVNETRSRHLGDAFFKFVKSYGMVVEGTVSSRHIPQFSQIIHDPNHR